MFGVEADLTFPNYLPVEPVVAKFTTARSDLEERWDYFGTVRGRVGYASGPWLAYATGGFAWAGERFLNTPAASASRRSISTSGPAGPPALDWNMRSRRTGASGSNISTASSAEPDVRFPSGALYNSTLDFQQVRIGLNRKVDWPGSTSWTPKTELTDPESDRWEMHGQTTYLRQGYPAFRAPYTGTNSLTPARQAQATWSDSLSLNARLWDGGEVYYNPELLQGFGLSDTVGLAGFSSGEAQKSNFPYPHYNTSRLFLRQTFGFGGEQEELASGTAQLAGKVDVTRLTLQAGKFSVGDVFDGNSYAKDTRKDFINWSIWAPGAFDYAADRLGLTYGVDRRAQPEELGIARRLFPDGRGIELQQIRHAGVRRGQYVAELETRYSLFSRPGKLRTIGWVNSAFSGSYRETLDNPALNLDIAQTRTGRIKYGYVFNVEQSVTDDIGLFGRWSWNNGKNEIMAFTDIDASPVARRLDQGHRVGPAGRHHRHRRRDQRAVARSSRLHRRRRARHLDRRRRSSTTARERILETYYASRSPSRSR